MERAHRFVTKNRFSLLRIALLFIFFSIEYWLILKTDAGNESFQFAMGYMGYMCLVVLFVFRGHNRRVYLSYELMLSLMMKAVVINGVTFFFLASSGLWCDLKELLIEVVLLIVANLLTILVVLSFINQVARVYYKKPEKILYVTAEDQVSEEKLASYDSVYLIDVPAQLRNDWLKLCYEKDKTVYTTAKLSDVLIRTSGIAQDEDKPVFYCTHFGISPVTAWIKRVTDVVMSCLAMLILWPIMLITAVAIKVEDGGKVIYSQTRCTKDLREFKIYKFRSMIETDENRACLATEEEDRITKVGRIIRKYKIDELPQLINIIKGDMSIVGPRPERPELIEENCKQVPEFVLRTRVKAGLTGYAQVRGRYETDKLDKLKWDLIYIENYSLLLDMKIIVITAIQLVKGKL